MPLIDALLLDPYPLNVWIAYRTDGAKGSGTLNDPYNGSTQTRFDGIMAMFQTQSYVTIHLGPGTFQTLGYAIGLGAGWQARPGMKILGSGIDVTTLQIINAGANEHHYALGHSLSSAAKVDYFEASDLTIDCNLPTGITSVACGAIRVLGDHAKIRRVKAIKWGTTATGSTRPCYVFSVIAALPDSGVLETVDCGIEQCLALFPSSNNVGQATAFHMGSQEDATITNEGFGKGPYIRNCFVDCALNTPALGGNYRALSMGWCRGGVVEGNQVYNEDIGGPYQDKRSTRDIIVRNNYYRNVARGPYWNLGGLAASLGTGMLNLTGNAATISSLSSVQGLSVGDRVKLVTSPTAFSGVYVITSIQQSPAQFTVTTPLSTPTSASVSSVQKVFGVSRAIVQGNLIELVQGVSGVAAVFIDDNNGSAYPEGPDYVHGDIFIRDNKSRYVDGVAPTGTSDLAIQVIGAKDLAISNNVIDTVNPNPMQTQRCGSVNCFNNKTPGGVLIQGWNATAFRKYDELETGQRSA